MTDRNITTDGMTEAQIEAATCPDPHRVVKNRDVDNKEVVNSEELIRGMTEMAERFTARMNTAVEHMTALEEVLNYVADMTYCGADAEWHFKPGYDPQRVLGVITSTSN